MSDIKAGNGSNGQQNVIKIPNTWLGAIVTVALAALAAICWNVSNTSATNAALLALTNTVAAGTAAQTDRYNNYRELVNAQLINRDVAIQNLHNAIADVKIDVGDVRAAMKELGRK